jgi:signal peptide peptidase SppA
VKTILSKHLGGPLLIAHGHEERFVSAMKQAEGLSLSDYVGLARDEHKYDVVDGVAILEVCGVILTEADPLLDFYEVPYVVTGHLLAAVQDALARSDVSSVLMVMDTPGGRIPLLQELHDLLATATKPTATAVTDLCASAGLYIGVATSHVFAGPAALIGSLGTVMVLSDYSGMAEQMGIKVHVISTGEHKGTGTPGAPITPEQLAPFQAIADGLCAQFQAAVAAGRELTAEAVAALATGEVWIASQAQAKGLVDTVTTNPVAAATAYLKAAMKITAQEQLDLIDANSAHASYITAEAKAGKSAAEIKAGIEGLKAKAVSDQIAKMEGLLTEAKTTITTERTAHATAIKAEQDAHTATKTSMVALQAKYDALAKLGGDAPRDPGADAAGEAAKGLKGEAAIKAHWESMPAARDYFHNDYASFAQAVESDGIEKVKAEIAKV